MKLLSLAAILGFASASFNQETNLFAGCEGVDCGNVVGEHKESQCIFDALRGDHATLSKESAFDDLADYLRE